MPINEIPEDLNDLIENGIVPGALERPLSLSTYADYFRALLFAEDHYIEVQLINYVGMLDIYILELISYLLKLLKTVVF